MLVTGEGLPYWPIKDEKQLWRFDEDLNQFVDGIVDADMEAFNKLDTVGTEIKKGSFVAIKGSDMGADLNTDTDNVVWIVQINANVSCPIPLSFEALVKFCASVLNHLHSSMPDRGHFLEPIPSVFQAP